MSAIRQHLALDIDADELEDLDAEVGFAPMPTSAEDAEYKAILQEAEEKVVAAEKQEDEAEPVKGNDAAAVAAVAAAALALSNIPHSAVIKRYDAIAKEAARVLRDAGIDDIADVWEDEVRKECGTNHDLIAGINYGEAKEPKFSRNSLHEVGELVLDSELCSDAMVPVSVQNDLAAALRKSVTKHLLLP